MNCSEHGRLILAARRWLKREGYHVIVTEMATANSETPDALGLRASASALIECKVTRADFLSDSKKQFRKEPSWGMGSKRYYLCPEGLIAKDEVPDGWGLIYLCTHNRLRDVKGPAIQARNETAERRILISILRRIALNPPENVGVRLYATNFKTHKTTVGIHVTEYVPREEQHESEEG
jgi:hypothetical protein